MSSMADERSEPEHEPPIVASTPAGRDRRTEPVGRADEAAEGRDTDFVQSLERGLAVLTAFGATSPAMTLSEVARRTGLTRATARRLLLTFETLGYMRSDGREFELTPKVLDLGYAFVSSLGLPQIAQPYMEELSERVNESVSAAVLDGNDIVYVARVPTKHVMSISLGLGSRLPAAITSMGRVLLAGLRADAFEAWLAGARWEPRTARSIRFPDELRHVVGECRRDGFAVIDQELEDNVRSVAVPITDRTAGVIAALNVGTSAARVSLSDLHERIVPELRATARAISTQMAKR